MECDLIYGQSDKLKMLFLSSFVIFIISKCYFYIYHSLFISFPRLTNILMNTEV